VVSLESTEFGKLQPNIYTLVSLQQDQADQVLVDKAIVSSDEILRMANSCSRGSARATPLDVDFDTLNSSTVRPVGVYGFVPDIVDFLHSNGALTIEAAQLLRKSPQRLSPGLHCAITDDGQVFVFFWPNAGAWVEPSRKNPACNFLRYLSEMCSTMVMCVSPEHAAVIPVTRPTQSSRRRDMALHVKQVQQSDDGIVIAQGFQCDTRGNAGSITTSGFSGVTVCTPFVEPSVVRTTSGVTRHCDSKNVSDIIKSEWGRFKLDMSEISANTRDFENLLCYGFKDEQIAKDFSTMQERHGRDTNNLREKQNRAR